MGARWSSGVGWSWRPATRPRRAASARRWARPRCAGCARRRWWSRHGSRPTRRPVVRCSRSSPTPRRWWRTCRSTRPSSRWPACGDCPGRRMAIGARLRARVRQEVGLPITVGIARTRFLAKVAGRVAKPDGLLLVAPEREREFLHPLPGAVLWGIGEATAARLTARGITTLGDTAALARRRIGRHRRGSGGSAVARGGRRAGRRAAAGRWSATPVDRLADRVGSAAPGPRPDRRDPAGRRRPGDAPGARGPLRGAHGGAAAAVRRLHGGHPLALAADGDRAHRDGAGGGPGFAGGGPTDDRATRPDPARSGARRRRPRHRGPAGSAVGGGRRSTRMALSRPPPTRSGPGSAPTRCVRPPCWATGVAEIR